ncbi:metal-dependent hydrolase [Mucilaginibacter xinganensis]|nr:metal-dependent hydrolase [Mucilaginibacter xinganensis]
MDSITHLTLGACVGEIILGKKMGKKALLWGAFAQSLPDIDTFFSPFYPVIQGFLIHRGITHSLLFAILAGVLLSLLAYKIHRRSNIPLQVFLFFFCFQLTLHDLLDTCNSYGTGLLEPFSHHRFSVNLLYVADPLFTISLIIATIFLIFKSTANPNRSKWSSAAILFSVVYLGFAGFNKTIINNRVNKSFQDQKITAVRYFSTPAPLNSMLWYIVAATDSSYYTGYISIFDDKKIAYDKHLKNEIALNLIRDTTLVNNLKALSEGDYTISQSGNNYYFNILRFGQVQGWAKPGTPFIFSYPLSTVNDSDGLLLQKRRLQDLNLSNLQRYLRRIAGQANF